AGIVTHAAGTDTVHSLDDQQDLWITGGSLTVAQQFTQGANHMLTVRSGASLILGGGGTAGGAIRDAGSGNVALGTTFTVTGRYTEMGKLTVPGTATLVVAGTLTNLRDGTLTGGTFLIGGTLQVTGASIKTNAANLALDNAASQIVDEANQN